jgi:hypothetical protein
MSFIIRVGTYQLWEVTEEQLNQLLWLRDQGIAPDADTVGAKVVQELHPMIQLEVRQNGHFKQAVKAAKRRRGRPPGSRNKP